MVVDQFSIDIPLPKTPAISSSSKSNSSSPPFLSQIVPKLNLEEYHTILHLLWRAEQYPLVQQQ
jgi:hypothetical protein